MRLIFMTEKQEKKKEIAYTLIMPEGISVTVEGQNAITIKGPKGEQKRSFKNYRVKIEATGNKVYVSGKPVTRKTLDIIKTVTAHIQKMTEGLLYGYKYSLKIVYSHFPMTAQVEKNKILIKNFLGEKFPRTAMIQGEAKVEAKGQDVIVTGNNLGDVSQTASNIEQGARVKGKDIRRYQDGIYLVSAGNKEEKPEGKVVEILRGRE